jgi:type I restriction enzyme S subunit
LIAREARIDEVAEAIIDYRGKTPPKATAGIPLLTAKVIKGGRIDDSRFEFISEETYAWWMRRGLPKRRDILITTEAPLGETAILRGDRRVALAQRVVLLRGNPRVIDQDYFFAALRSPLVQDRLRQRATGTTVLGIKQRELRQVLVPLPPLQVQRKIGAILSAYDDLIDNNNQRIKILEEMAQRIYREWFVDFRYPGYEEVPLTESVLGPIPAGWTVRPLAHITATVTRGVSPKYGEDSQRLVINQKCIRDGRLNLALGRRHHTDVPISKMLQRGDVLVNSTGVGTLGRVAQVLFEPSDLTVDSHVTIVRPEPAEVTADFLGLTMLAREAELAAMGVGSTGQTELNRSGLAGLLITVAPRHLQETFAVAVGPLRSLAVTLATSTVNLHNTRDLLLPRLVSGEVDVTDLEIAVPELAA